MSFSVTVGSNLCSNSSHRFSKVEHCLQFCCLRLNWKCEKLALWTTGRRRSFILKITKSIRNNRNSSISNNGASEPARILLERLFAQTQKLEEQMRQESQGVRLGLNLEMLESDLEAALSVLQKKEEELQDAEQKVLMEHSELKSAKEELEQREKDIVTACSKYETLEEELKEANLSLTSQARQIEDLKLHLRERDLEIADAKTALSLREEELDRIRDELSKKREEAAKTHSKFESKAQLLKEANEVVYKQESEVQRLQKAMREKEEGLEVSMRQRKLEEEKLKVAEANLEKQAMEWLLTQQELKKLAAAASKTTGETNKMLMDFRKVKKLIGAVRSELVSSQKSLAFSRKKMEEQNVLLEKQLAELEVQKKSVMSYMTSLKDAQIEIESERVKLRLSEARNKKLEQDLSVEEELVEDLQEELEIERSSLQQAMGEMSSLQEKLEQKNNEFKETRDLLHFKESELGDAKIEIQHLKSEMVALELILGEKDLELLNAKNKLKEVSNETSELKMLLTSRENQLIQATSMLKEKDEHVQIIHSELHDIKQKFFEAESVVERVAELTKKLVTSIKDEDDSTLVQFDVITQDLPQQLWETPSDNYRLHIKQLETELELTRDSLKRTEIDVLDAQRSLAIKDEELQLVLGSLNAKDKELLRMKDEMTEDTNDLRKLYALAQEIIGDKTIGDLAVEKLQFEAAQLNIEAATSALHKLAELSRQLSNKDSLSIEAESEIYIFPNSGSSKTNVMENNEHATEVKSEVARLSALTEKLVKEAGIVVAAH